MSKVDLFDKEAKASDWISSNFWVPELHGPMWLAPYQIETMDMALEKDAEDNFKHALIMWSDVKKSIKCQRGDTLVWMQDGTHKRADQISVGDRVWGYVFDGDENTSSLYPDVVSGVEIQVPSPLVEIKTSRGRSVVVTENHPFLIEGMENRYPSYKSINIAAKAFSWIDAKDLSVGRRVVIGLDMEAFEPELDCDFYAFGAYIGDGYGSVMTSETKEIMDVFERVDSLCVTKRKDTVWQRYAYGLRGATKWLAGFGYDIHGKNSYTKHIPESVFKGTKQQIASFLSGYFDADGTVCDPDIKPRIQMSWGSVNHGMLLDCQRLLASLGVNSILRKLNSIYRGEPYTSYMLVVSDKQQALRLMRLLTVQHSMKKERFEKWIKKIMLGSTQCFDGFTTDRITEINRLPPEETIAIEVEKTHAHITNGMVTHNSSIAAAVALWRAFQLDWGSIKVVANDLKQAKSRSYFYLERSLLLNPATKDMLDRGEIKITKYTIDFLFNNTKIEAIPADPKGEAGGNDDMVLFTELWTYQHEAHQRLFTELVVPPNKFGKSFRWAESYAGFTGQSAILENIYQANVKDEYKLEGTIAPLYKNGGTFVMWNQEPRLPWQSSLYYRQQMSELSEDEFRRVHRNEWVGSTTKFIQDLWWDSCRVESTKIEEQETVVVAVDAAYAENGDCFSIVVVGKHPTQKDKYAVKEAKFWQAGSNGKLDFKNVNDEGDPSYPFGYVMDLAKRYRVLEVAYDPYQLHSMATEQNKKRLAFWKEFTQGKPRSVADNEL